MRVRTDVPGPMSFERVSNLKKIIFENRLATDDFGHNSESRIIPTGLPRRYEFSLSISWLRGDKQLITRDNKQSAPY